MPSAQRRFRCDRRHSKKTYSMARRIAANIAKLPELLC
jgi:hypothetical protein